MGLKKTYQPYFPIGAAVPASAFDNASAQKAMVEQYASITCENDMKPEALLDKEANQKNFIYYKAEVVFLQGSYTAAVYFADNEVTNPVAGADLVAKGTDAGGCVNEDMMVQGNRVLLESRYECQFQKQVK